MYFHYINCEWEASTWVFFSMHFIVKNLPDDDKKWLKCVADDNWMYNVLKVVFALTRNTDVDQQTQQHVGTKICSTICS
jgi:hypothetical protein